MILNTEYLASRKEIMEKLGFSSDKLAVLKNYIELLCSANEELNLISRKMTFQELIDNHVIDCLLPLRFFPQNLKTVADFGSGGGLPSVIYAIQFPEVQFHLYEKSPLKQEFLNRCKELAPNLNVHGEIPRDFGKVDLVTSRAFKPVDVILEMSRNYYQQGGRYFLLKGRKEKIDEELIAAKKKFKNLGTATQVHIEKIQSPVLEVERHLVRVGGF